MAINLVKKIKKSYWYSNQDGWLTKEKPNKYYKHKMVAQKPNRSAIILLSKQILKTEPDVSLDSIYKKVINAGHKIKYNRLRVYLIEEGIWKPKRKTSRFNKIGRYL